MIRSRICGKESGPLLGYLLEEMFSAQEDLSESSDDPTRGLGRWMAQGGQTQENRRFEKPIEAMLLEKELVKVANSMSQCSRKVSMDIEGPVLDMDLSIATPAVSQQVPSTLLDTEGIG